MSSKVPDPDQPPSDPLRATTDLEQKASPVPEAKATGATDKAAPADDLDTPDAAAGAVSGKVPDPDQPPADPLRATTDLEQKAAPAAEATDAGTTEKVAPSHDLQTPAASAGTGWKAVLGEEFDWMEAMGGRRGIAESVAPGLAFVVIYVIHPALWPAVLGSLGVAVVLAVVRLIQRGTLMGAISGLGGILIGAIWAGTTGRAENYLVWGLWVNAGWLAGSLLSIAIRFPFAAVVVAFFTDHLKGFRQNKLLMRRGYWVTWLLAGLFAARLAAQLPLYFNAEVAWLGTVKLAMGLPLFALVLWAAWWWMRPVVKPSADSDSD